MKISLIIPTNRISYSAIARVFEAVALDPDKFEVIVRDNSENEEKRAILETITSPICRVSMVPNRGPYENLTAAFREASGDFVFFLADDDWISARGLNQLHSLALQSAADRSVVCLTGAYLIDTSSGTGFLQYKGLDSYEPTKRLASYLEANATNVLYYSAVKRELATFCFTFMASLPYKFSYIDQLVSIFYLALGRVLQVDRVVYQYDLGDWETAEGSLSKDKASYVAAGLPAEFDRLHWLFCALEGAFLLNSQVLAQKVNYDRTPLAEMWFDTLFNRFKLHDRGSAYSDGAINSSAIKLRNKCLSSPRVDKNELLLDICDVLEISDKAGAERYFGFWSTL
jgi:glycosyltransferase involved in cell wall biosynthesis